MNPLIIMLSVFSLTSVLHGQDPTVPSQAILDRIQSTDIRIPTIDVQPPPTFKLRAMVMQSRDQGAAFIEANGSRIYLRLDRTVLEPRQAMSDSMEWTCAFEFQGVQYRLVDFSSRCIVLTDGLHHIQIR